MRRALTGFVLLWALFPAVVWGHGGDIVPYVEGGRIVTGSYNHDGDAVEEYVRVFGYDFDTPVIEGPGVSKDADITNLFFNAFGKTPTLPASNSLSYSPVAIGGSVLSYWNGSGPISFTPADADVAVGIRTLTDLQGTFSSTGFTGAAFSFNTGASGSLHQHLSSRLLLDGSPSLLAPEGLYLLALQLSLSSSGLTSDPVYIVYNHGLEEDLHLAGMAWVEANLVPEPGSLTLAAIAGIGVLSRFRRRLAKHSSS